MSNLYFIHAFDDTTSFLAVFQEQFGENFYTIVPNKDSINCSLEYIQQIPENSTVVFLGHGQSTGLYTPEAKGFEKYIFIDKLNGNQLFVNKKIILLSCRSNEFINKLDLSSQLIGFGNIISSPKEIGIEAETETGHYRNLSKENIDYFNNSYCTAIINALSKHISGSYKFSQIPHLVEFYINQKINDTLLNKNLVNRVEIARLLFEFRNEMVYKKYKYWAK